MLSLTFMSIVSLMFFTFFFVGAVEVFNLPLTNKYRSRQKELLFVAVGSTIASCIHSYYDRHLLYPVREVYFEPFDLEIIVEETLVPVGGYFLLTLWTALTCSAWLSFFWNFGIEEKDYETMSETISSGAKVEEENGRERSSAARQSHPSAGCHGRGLI